MQDELDILREVGSIAACHAASALSEFLERKVTLDVPSVDIATVPSVDMLSCKEIPKNITLEKIETAIFSNISTGLQGGVAFILQEDSVLKLIDLSCRRREEERKTSVVVETGLSFMRDIGNIMIGSYLSTLDSMLGRTIIPAFPTLLNGLIDHVFYSILSPYRDEEYLCLIETIFQEAQEKIKGGFYLILSPQSISDIRTMCKRLLEKKGDPGDKPFALE